MAVNPKLILIASELAGNEKVRKTLLYVLFFSLGLIMLIFVVFIGLISGLLSIAQDNDLRNHWNYYRTSISEVFGGIEGEINSDVKSEVYDFMPEFSVNLSKATIANNFDNSSLILYDEKEIRQAQEIMQDYAEKLRSITTEEAFDSFISGYETELSFSDIRNIRFTDDTGIGGISAYPDALKLFLYNRAMEQMPAYSYSFEEITVDGKPADRQTLVVTSPDGSTQTVEYTCIGGGEVYLPEFLAMYNIRQSREYLTAVTQNQAPDIESKIEQAVGGIPETAEEAQNYLNGAWQGMVDGRGAVNMDLFRMANLKSIIKGASIDGVSNAGTITLFLEFTCLSEVEFEDADIGNSLDSGDIIVGDSHEGYYSVRYDSGLWWHSLNRDECVPHIGVKTYFMSGEVSQPEPPLGTHYYCGPSAKDIGVAANPRLWFKGFRTGMSEELFGTIRAVGE